MSRRGLEVGCCPEPVEAPGYLAPGDGHPEAAPLRNGQAPYTALRSYGGQNYERDETGGIATKTLPASIDQFRAGDIEQGLAYRQPL